MLLLCARTSGNDLMAKEKLVASWAAVQAGGSVEAAPPRVMAAEESNPRGPAAPSHPSRPPGNGTGGSLRESVRPPSPQHPPSLHFLPSWCQHPWLAQLRVPCWGHYRTQPPEGQNARGPAVSWNPSESKPSLAAGGWGRVAQERGVPLAAVSRAFLNPSLPLPQPFLLWQQGVP